MSSTIRLDNTSGQVANQLVVAAPARPRLEPGSAPPVILRREESGPAPLSFAQERFWFLDQINPGDASSNIAPRDRLEEQLVTLRINVLQLKSIGIRDNMFELGGHSLLAARLFAPIENRFAKHIPLATLFQSPTIEQLANALRDSGTSKAWSSLVAIQAEGSRPPLFCVHATGANVLIYRPLSRHLGNDQPVYALQAQGLDGQARPLTRVEGHGLALYWGDARFSARRSVFFARRFFRRTRHL